MTDTNEPTVPDATCTFCGDSYSGERAEIGYAYCMKKECSSRGQKEKNAAPIELEVIQPETRF